jgi:hypothetical protein
MLYRTEEVVSENIPDCLIAVTAPEKMIKEPLNWWKSNGCSGSFSTFKYYYVIEQLGIDPCAVIDPVNKTVADWFRITLNFFAKKGDARIFLQSTFTRPATTIEQCASLQYHAQTGRQSLRELNY